jgi:hypothetical protein
MAVACTLCDHTSHDLAGHVTEVHDLTPAKYEVIHGGLSSPELLAELEKAAPRRSAAPAPTDLKVKMLGVEFPVDPYVSEGVCLPKPKGYMWPTKGRAKKEYKRVLIALARSKPVFVWGGPGTGKDAIFHAFSEDTGTPALIFTFTPGADIRKWFFSRAIGLEGTSWEYGALWRALTEGVKGTDGVARPALILFSDVDRGTPEQLEEFRLVLDTTSKRIVGPTGEVSSILPGTRFAFTANSCGTGDDTGRMSSQAMDASLLDRMGRFVEFVHMVWEDECRILRGKFPVLLERCPELLDQLGFATNAIREGIKNRTLYAEFTHRGLCEVLGECDDLIWAARGDSVPANLLKNGFKAWLHRLDPDQRLVAKRLIDAGIAGGVVANDDDEDY